MLRPRNSKTPWFSRTIEVLHNPRPFAPGGFRVNASVRRQLNRRQRRILRRLENKPGIERPGPMMTASNIHYEMSDKVRGIAPGGIGALHLLARKVGLIQDLDEGLHLLKRHLPYHESDPGLTHQVSRGFGPIH